MNPPPVLLADVYSVRERSVRDVLAVGERHVGGDVCLPRLDRVEGLDLLLDVRKKSFRRESNASLIRFGAEDRNRLLALLALS